MENSFLRQNLMKRRFSVPETVMRKHSLQNLALRLQVSDPVVTNTPSSSTSESTVYEKTCQTSSSPARISSSVDDDPKLVASSKRGTSRTRKRKSYRLLRKSSSSYCQYRYTMSGFSKQTFSQRADKVCDPQDPQPFDNSRHESVNTNNSDSIYSIEYSNDSEAALEARTRSPKTNQKRLPEIREFPACPQRVVELVPNGCGGDGVQPSPIATTSVNEPQNVPTDFPLIVQSESVFHHPSQTGCATRETHSISIEILPSCGESQYPETKSYIKTAVRVDREVRGKGPDRGSVLLGGEYEYSKESQKEHDEIDAGRWGADHGSRSHNVQFYLRRPVAEDRITPELGTTRVKFVDEVKATSPPAARSSSLNSSSENEDCAVPMSILDCLAKKNGTQQLNIQVNVGKVGALENALLIPTARDTDALPPCPNDGQKPTNKDESHSKMALSYLFQKLGDTYPKPQKRLLLKEPTFLNYRSQSEFGQYYSGLPKLSDTPVSLMYKCNIPPAERKTCSAFLPDTFVTKRLDDGERSDSDVSVADSLEDSQITKDRSAGELIANNKYCKYDQRLARGDVSETKENTTSERAVVNGVSYFLQFSEVENGIEGGRNVRQEIADDHAPHMPNNLLERLNRRSNSISKHSHCLATCKSRDFVHKQIQTCFNARESLRRKRRTRVAEPTLDERIAKILITGLEMQEGPNAALLATKPSAGRVTSEGTAQPLSNGSIDGQQMIDKVEGLYWFHYSAERAEKKDAGEDMPTSSRYRYQKNKLKYFEERKLRKQRYTVPAPCDDDPRSKLPENRKPVTSKERRNPPKVRNNKANVFGSRFHQKFEAIPEEMANGLNERCDINKNRLEETGPKSQAVDEVNCADVPRVSKLNLETDVDNHHSDTTSKFDARNGDLKCAYCKGTRPKVEVGDTNDSIAAKFVDELNTAGTNPRDSEDENADQSQVESWVKNQHAAIEDSGNFRECDTVLQNRDDLLKSPSNDARCPEKYEKTSKNDEEGAMEVKSKFGAGAITSEIDDKCESSKIACTREKESPKRTDVLYSGNAKEELITLSRGWINFYLLKAGNVGPDDGSNVIEDTERDMNDTTEDPQQYMLHIQAVPQTHSASNMLSVKQRTRTLPDLSQLLESSPPQRVEHKRHTVSSKINSTFPEISVQSTKTPPPNHRISNDAHLCNGHQGTVPDASRVSRGENKNSPSLPNLSPTCLDVESDVRVRTNNLESVNQIALGTTTCEPETVNQYQNGGTAAASSFWSESTAEINVRSTGSSSATSSGHCSTSSAGDEVGVATVQTDSVVESSFQNSRNTRSRKTQHNLRPPTYHPAASRQDCYRRSLSVESNRHSANKKNPTAGGMVDIEMRLLVKNHGAQDDNGNRSHSWKFTLTSDDPSNVNKNERSSKSRYAFCTPNRNINHYHNQTRAIKLSGCSETTSTSTSTCSLNDRKRSKEVKLSSECELNGHALRSDGNLTVTGSSIIPESKPKPLTMSERDITRARFSKYSSNINKL